MPGFSKNTSSIELLTAQEIAERFNGVAPSYADGKPLSTIIFKKNCQFFAPNIEELKEMLRLWIIAEETRYPPEKGFKGRWLLFDEIKKVFDHTHTTPEK